jgi:flagellar assembly factor FliW
MTQQVALKDQIVTHSSDVAPTLSQQLGVEAKNIVSFPDGLPGFEACRQFAVFSSEEAAPLQCLHALDGPKASFIVIDPSVALANYRCELSAADRSRLGVESDNELLWLAIVTVASDGSITANLRAPVVINPARMIGFQVMPYQCVYPLRHVIAGPR